MPRGATLCTYCSSCDLDVPGSPMSSTLTSPRRFEPPVDSASSCLCVPPKSWSSTPRLTSSSSHTEGASAVADLTPIAGEPLVNVTGRRKLEERTPAMHKAYAKLDEAYAIFGVGVGEQEEGDGRRLFALSTSDHGGFMQTASQTNWCGTGHNMCESPCPGNGGMASSALYSYQSDHACRRHDHGGFSQAGICCGMKQLSCKVDKDLIDGVDDWSAGGISANSRSGGVSL